MAAGLTAITLAACETTQEMGQETATALATTEAAMTVEAAASSETAATTSDSEAGSEPAPATQPQATTATPPETAAGEITVSDCAGQRTGHGVAARRTAR